MMGKNKLKLLEKENQEIFYQIVSDDSRKILSDMLRYVSSFSLGMYQTQIIYKDLLGMALEAQMLGITLSEKLGVEPLAFCDDIIENMKENAGHERLLKAALTTLQAFAFYCTFAWFFFEGMPKTFNISLGEILLYGLGCGVLSYLLSLWSDRIALRHEKWRRSLPYIGFTLSVVALIAILKFTNLASVYVITGVGWGIVAVMDAIAVAATLLWNHYIGRTR